mmetsp:Transcript_31721/g.67234  ORF Transcript_31721/g.67234 Transcript_31721/m.67234 type:complete len:99 (+) Transcript_31721:302-598(+)
MDRNVKSFTGSAIKIDQQYSFNLSIVGLTNIDKFPGIIISHLLHINRESATEVVAEFYKTTALTWQEQISFHRARQQSLRRHTTFQLQWRFQISYSTS